MPAFGATPPAFLSPGDTLALVNNAAVEAGITFTQAVVITQSAGISIADRLFVQNLTNQTVTIYTAVRDFPSATANYSPLTDADTGTAVTVAASTSISLANGGPFLCGHFATPPTTGSLFIGR